MVCCTLILVVNSSNLWCFKFYSEAILSRRGPLAKVWLAAHMERKLSKAQTLQTDIEQSVGTPHANHRTVYVFTH